SSSLAITACSAVEAARCRAGMRSLFAPNAGIFAACVAAGFALGVIGVIFERHDLLHHRQWRLHVLRMPRRDRFRWPVLRENLKICGWFILLICVLYYCCVFYDVNPFPPFFASWAVIGFANKKLARDFHKELIACGS